MGSKRVHVMYGLAPGYEAGFNGKFVDGPRETVPVEWMDCDGLIFEIEWNRPPQLAVDAVLPMIGQMGEAMYQQLRRLAATVGGQPFDAMLLMDAAPWAYDPDSGKLSRKYPMVNSCEDPVYLANEFGAVTGEGSVRVAQEDLDKVPFNRGPGFVLPYLTEIKGAKYLQGNLEISYKDAFWGDAAVDLHHRPAALAYSVDLRNQLLSRAKEGTLVLPLDDSEPGRIIVRTAIPLDAVKNEVDGDDQLAFVFGSSAFDPEWFPAAMHDGGIDVCCVGYADHHAIEAAMTETSRWVDRGAAGEARECGRAALGALSAGKRKEALRQLRTAMALEQGEAPVSMEGRGIGGFQRAAAVVSGDPAPTAKGDRRREEVPAPVNLMERMRNELLWLYDEVWPLVHELTCRNVVKERFKRLPELIHSTPAAASTEIGIRMEGGAIQSVWSNQPVNVLVIDYDAEDRPGDELSDMPQDDGRVSPCVIDEFQADVMPDECRRIREARVPHEPEGPRP